MSFFSGLRGMMSGSKPGLPLQWNVPEREADVDKFFESGIHVVYKHSYSCATSIFAKLRVEEVLNDYAEKARFHFIDVRQGRAISEYAALKTGVRHESPQIIVIKDGKIIWHASHGAIQQERVINALK